MCRTGQMWVEVSRGWQRWEEEIALSRSEQKWGKVGKSRCKWAKVDKSGKKLTKVGNMSKSGQYE